MQWSKLKSRVMQCISPELQGRVDFHLTSYRKSHDEADKVWITIDGERIFTCQHYRYEFGARELIWIDGLNLDEAKTALHCNEVHQPKEFGEAMRVYLDLPIEEALRSADPFIKAFALIDRRTGKRTIERIEISDSEHTLVKAFYNLRK